MAAAAGSIWTRPSTYTTVFLLLAIAGTVLSSSENDDVFDTLDSNHDGFLDKSEYQQGFQKLSAFLKQPLSAAGSGSSGSSSFSSWISANYLSLEAVSLQGFWKAFTSSFAMIMATEIGDKTFFIAAILSMKHSRVAVFSGAILALIVMTILSTAMGLILPAFMPRKYTHWLGGALFMYFGFKLLYDSREMDAGKASEELEEVEEELGGSSNKKADEEEGGRSMRKQSSGGATKNAYQIAIQAFTLTFLAEWGDRSQIATIALAAAKNPLGVTIGGSIGHSVCTGFAVLGGRMVAARISEKSVSQFGGIIFCIFGIHSLFFETESME
eukprot:CAMPEP_0198146490 /NCGR_PEP_ID=MMETSP1443-20131203/29608_1 /TAXON_ID=186043 /ORGANISM="Entomoneis sp., Strain CCMP2396" /LENGTH=326 /DNA_ID=CAMNT_0043810475 /DNA_START=32 /DNA_END=1012 /DNA_ORIENTATION=+